MSRLILLITVVVLLITSHAASQAAPETTICPAGYAAHWQQASYAWPPQGNLLTGAADYQVALRTLDATAQHGSVHIATLTALRGRDIARICALHTAGVDYANIIPAERQIHLIFAFGRPVNIFIYDTPDPALWPFSVAEAD